MQNVPEHLHGYTHPMVEEIYMKKDYTLGKHGLNVLVIKASIENKNMMSLMEELHDVQQLAEQQLGRIDRVDVTTH